MRIKELSLLGFKSFATRTRLVFPGGVTAIVGPNGSGKSNVADAVRWVLGEGRTSTLRARTAEEMIFAGTERRARGGLAEVTLVIDNADGDLGDDLDFAEVAITRRVQRDGASGYFINEARVRRQDVLDLIGGALGQGDYTVIGQGLVDSFLSMRPAQRRGLIEEAAGIAPLQRRAESTLRKLVDCDENLTRVRDVLADIGPRLRRMTRLAERASVHKQLSDELAGLLTTWYAHRYHRERSVHALARKAEAEMSAGLEALHARQEASAALVRESEAAVETAEAALGTMRQERERLFSALAELRQRIAVESTRLDGLRSNAAELERVRSSGPERGSGDGGRLAELESALEAARAAREAAVGARDEVVARVRAQEDEARARSEDLERFRTQESASGAAMAALAARIDGLEGLRTARVAEALEAEQRASAAASRLPELITARDAAHARREASESALEAARAGVTAAEAALRSAEAALSDARETHAEARAATLALVARAEALDSVFVALDAPADIIAALRDLDARAVIGTLAELIEVEPGWEAAVAAALGTRSSAVVLADRAALVAGLELLAERAGIETALVAADPSPGAGAEHGVRRRRDAAPHGSVRAAVRPAAGSPDVVRAALGRLAFAEDIASALALLDGDDALDAVVTRAGIRIEAAGSAQIGGGTRELLSLVAERRELPGRRAELEAAERAAAEAVDARLARRLESEGELGRWIDARAAAEAESLAVATDFDAAREACQRAEREHEWASESSRQLQQEVAEIDAQLQVLEASAREATGEGRSSFERIAEAKAALEAIDLTAARAELAERSAEAAAAAQRVAGLEAELAAARRDAEATAERAAIEDARRVELAETIAAADAALAAERERVEVEARSLAEADGRLVELDAALRAERERQRERVAELEDARNRASALESRLADARLQVSRAEDRLERLAEQLTADGEIVELPPGTIEQLAIVEGGMHAGGTEGASESGDDGPQASAPAPEPVSAVVELPEGLERRIGDLRRELRQIGAIDREALAAYEETAEHHRELEGQVADLEAAKSDLETALAALDEQMAERFDAAFETVSHAFAKAFPRLFGGGEATLRIEADEEGASGIEIIARPPGKRPQPLGLLSGGERAITAVALVFALLQASGTPFVVLDEVDAALDEANVDRFRAALRELSESVQIVIITHNRATVESADTVYGVTMSDDGSSRTVSLRVEDAA